MFFALTDEQQAFAETVRDFVADRFDLDAVRGLVEDEAGDGHPLTLWKGLADQGALAVLVPEEHDGLGLGLLDAQVIARELGRAVASAQTGARISRLPQWISCHRRARRLANRPLAWCMAWRLISSICPRAGGICASGTLGRLSSRAAARTRPRRLRATSRLSAGLSWAMRARLASRRMARARVGLSCSRSTMSRRDRRLSARARRTRSCCSAGTGSGNSSSNWSQEARRCGSGVWMGMLGPPNWFLQFAAYSLARFLR